MKPNYDFILVHVKTLKNIFYILIKIQKKRTLTHDEKNTNFFTDLNEFKQKNCSKLK